MGCVCVCGGGGLVMDAHGGCPHYCSGRAIFSNLGSV